MNVLITGISGFVGTNLVCYFEREPGVKILGHSRNRNLNIQYLNDWAAETLNSNQVDAVIHLAGIAHDLSNQFTAEDYYTVNYGITKALVDEVLKSNVKKFIYVSSIKALCDSSSVPATEEITPNPLTDYGKSKRKAEEYIQSKSWEEKSFYILRPAMIHGPGNKGNLNLLYRFVKSGLPFPFGNYQNQRSFLSVDNFCWVIKSLFEKESTSGIYHLADDHFLSTVELYQLISEALNRKPLVLKVPKSLIEVLAALMGRKAMVAKLTENMMISNLKIKQAIGEKMPLSLQAGLIKTIHSFDGK